MMAASSGTSHEVWPHLLTLGFSTVAFSTFYVLSPTISAALFGTRYTQLSSRARRDWNARTVALVHALIILSLAVRALSSLDLPQDRIFGVDRSGAARLACAVAAGYFVWDVAVSAFVLRDLAFVVHGVLCCGIYVHSLRPFLAHYAVRFLLWELSTPLLNIHWFLDKLGKTGSKLQLVNGIALLTVFALVRLAYGPYLSANFVGDMIAVRAQIHPVVLVAYILGNAVLNGLNYFWFYKMIKSLRKRFGRSDQPKKREFELVDT